MRIIGCILILALLMFFNWAFDIITMNIEFNRIFVAVLRRIQVCTMGMFIFIVNILPFTLIYITIVMSCAIALYEVWCRREDILERSLD